MRIATHFRILYVPDWCSLLDVGRVWETLPPEASELLAGEVGAAACFVEDLAWPFCPKKPFRGSIRVVELSFGSEENMRPAKLSVNVTLKDMWTSHLSVIQGV